MQRIQFDPLLQGKLDIDQSMLARNGVNTDGETNRKKFILLNAIRHADGKSAWRIRSMMSCSYCGVFKLKWGNVSSPILCMVSLF